MIAAVLPAAGAGERFKTAPGQPPKQFIELGGRPLYLWSLHTLACHTTIEHIVLVVPKGTLVDVQFEVNKHLQLPLCEKVLVTGGGPTRQDSVRRGLEMLSRHNFAGQELYVLIHDAVRPLLTEKMIDDTIASVTEHGACSLAIPVTDTIKSVSGDILAETLDRTQLVQIQTPQAGKLEWLLAAHRRAAAENFATTDDSTILEYNGHKVHIVPGSPYNLKITNPEDLSICESLALSMKQIS